MDEGKKWMIISGGGGKAGGLKVDTNTKSNLLKKNGIDSDAMYERIRQKTMEHYKISRAYTPSSGKIDENAMIKLALWYVLFTLPSKLA